MPKFIKFAPLILAVCLSSLMTGCGRESIQGKGEAKQEHREIKTFSAVDINGNFDIVGTIGQPDELVISSNPNILPYIKSSVDNDTLAIKSDDSVNLQPTVTQGIWFTTNEFLSLHLSGNTQFQLANLNGDKLECDLKGSHKVFLKGKLTSLKIVTSGSTNINAQDLQVTDADIEINGSGVIAINVSNSLKVKINGDGKVIYNGQPKVQQTINGSGQVSSAFGGLEKH